jgi:hypothetical protein
MSDLLHFLTGSHPLPLAVILGAGFAFTLRTILMFRSPPGGALPHPSKVPGLPMAGPASTTAAHAALSRQSAAARPKFHT